MTLDPTLLFTTDDLVKGIIETDETIPDLTPFIASAHELIVELCMDPKFQPPYSDQRLELIERWLSAHFYAIRDMRSGSETAGSVSQSYQYKLGQNLNVTMYGQQALALDTYLGLAVLSKQAETGKHVRKIGFGYLGPRKCRGGF